MIYLGLFDKYFPIEPMYIIEVSIADEIPEHENPVLEYHEIDKEIFFDFQWKEQSNTYHENTEITKLFLSLHQTSNENGVVSFNEFYKNLYVYAFNDIHKYPYDLTAQYGDAIIHTISHYNERQIEVFNDILIFGKYLEEKTSHSNLLSKMYDLITPTATYVATDGYVITRDKHTVILNELFDKTKYPSLN